MTNIINLKISDNSKHISESKGLSERFSEVEKLKLAKASKDFESILTSMMLKSMTKNSEGLLGGGENFGGEVFDTLFEQEMASNISDSKSLGIANMIYKRMTGEDLPLKKSVDNKPIINTPKVADVRSDNNNVIDDSPIVSEDKKVNDSTPISPNQKAMKRLEKYEDIINQASEKYGVDKSIIKSVILTESAAKENAISSCKAKGLMQLMDFTAKDMGVKNVWDPKENIMGGTKYLSQMIDKYNGNLEFALAAYNAGPGNVNKYDGIPPFKETQNYVSRVKSYLGHFENDSDFV